MSNANEAKQDSVLRQGKSLIIAVKVATARERKLGTNTHVGAIDNHRHEGQNASPSPHHRRTKTGHISSRKTGPGYYDIQQGKAKFYRISTTAKTQQEEGMMMTMLAKRHREKRKD